VTSAARAPAIGRRGCAASRSRHIRPSAVVPHAQSRPDSRSNVTTPWVRFWDGPVTLAIDYRPTLRESPPRAPPIPKAGKKPDSAPTRRSMPIGPRIHGPLVVHSGTLHESSEPTPMSDDPAEAPIPNRPSGNRFQSPRTGTVHALHGPESKRKVAASGSRPARLSNCGSRASKLDKRARPSSTLQAR